MLTRVAHSPEIKKQETSMLSKTSGRRALCGAAILGSFGAWAQGGAGSYPDRPIRLIVPFAAGGPADVVAREVAQLMGQDLGQSVVIDNQGGGAGVPALNTVARASADGYTLLFAASGNVVVQPLLQKSRVDVLTQLAPIGMVSTSPHVLVVTGKLPIRNLAELLAYARANPGKLNFGSAGVGGLAHLGMELFKYSAKIDINHVPYKGTSQVMSDLAGGEVQALFSSMPSLKGMIDKKLITPVGITGPSSSPSMAELPVIGKTVPGFEYTTWYGMYATAGTPRPVIEKINASLRKLGGDKSLRERLDAQGVDLRIGSPRELADLTRKETAQWDKTIRDAGITLN